MKINGFTLAEALVSLLIIGVVAVLSIPVLLQSIQEQQDQTAYKKGVSILSEARQKLTLNENDNNSCGTISSSNDLAACMRKILTGSLNDNVIVASDNMTYTFFWRKGSDGTFLDCGESTLNTEDNWKGTDANCVVVVDIDGQSKRSVASDDYTAKIAITEPSGTDLFPMILTQQNVRPAFYIGSKGYEYTYGKQATEDEKPWENDS